MLEIHQSASKVKSNFDHSPKMSIFHISSKVIKETLKNIIILVQENKFYHRHFLMNSINDTLYFQKTIVQFLSAHMITLVKFGYSEKATKLEKIFHLKFDVTEQRQILRGRFFQEYPNFTRVIM